MGELSRVHRSLSRMPRQEPSCYGLARICSEFAVLRSLPMAHRPSFGHAWRGSRRRLDLGSVGDQLGAPSNAPGAGDPPAHETLPFFSGVAFTPDGAIALAACDRYTVPAKLRPRDRPELPAWWHRGVRAFRLSDGQELDLVPLYTPIREIFVS